MLNYVLITPARDEARFIELTIKSVVAQTARPLKWIIVSDGSTDETDDIVSKYAAEHPWIELARMPERRERHFAAKVFAFNAGYAKLCELNYDAVGSLDGDISFDEGFFAFLLQKLDENPGLGLVGAPFQESSGKTYDYRFASLENVSGACQLFRRQCFEDVGGYTPLKEGGIDHVAAITARMKGWKTRTFTEKACLHHRKMGTARHGYFGLWFKNGTKDYSFGNHPVWELFRMCYQMANQPFVLGALLLGAGYFWALMVRHERPIPAAMIAFIRREQMRRLRSALTRPFSKANPKLREGSPQACGLESGDGR